MRLPRFPVLVVLIFTVFTISAAAVDDFGFSIDNATGFTVDGEAAATQKNKVSHWLYGKIGDRLSLAYQISYTFSLDRYVLLDLDLLSFGGTFIKQSRTPFLFRFTTGRFTFSEFSSAVLSHVADGFRLDFGVPSAVFTLSTAYTGLLQTPVSTILLSASDVADQTVDPVPVFGPLAPPRLITAVTAEFPELFLQQSLNLAFLFQFDLRGEEKTQTDKGRVHTQYYGIGLSGPLASVLFYDAFFYFNSGLSDPGIILGVLSGGSFTLFLQKALSSRAELGFIAASGDADHSALYEGNTEGESAAFLPISASSSGLVVSPRLTNVFYPWISYSIKPFSFIDKPAAENFSAALKTFPFFRATPGTVSVSGVDPASDSLYLGTELDIILSARVLSDLGLGFSTGFFFPGTAIGNKAVRVLGRFDLSLSL